MDPSLLAGWVGNEHGRSKPKSSSRYCECPHISLNLNLLNGPVPVHLGPPTLGAGLGGDSTLVCGPRAVSQPIRVPTPPLPLLGSEVVRGVWRVERFR
mgnify:FL=1